MTANLIMNNWVNSRRTLALQDVAGHLAGAMQQLYFSLNHASVPAENVSYAPETPPLIEDNPFMANGTLQQLSGPGLNSSKGILLTVKLMGTSNSVTTTVVLGPNIIWNPSVFLSNSTDAVINAQKFNDGTILLQFEG